MIITGEKAGLQLQTDKAVQAALQYGKEGSFLTRELNYIKSLSKTNDP